MLLYSPNEHWQTRNKPNVTSHANRSMEQASPSLQFYKVLPAVLPTFFFLAKLYFSFFLFFFFIEILWHCCLLIIALHFKSNNFLITTWEFLVQTWFSDDFEYSVYFFILELFIFNLEKKQNKKNLLHSATLSFSITDYILFPLCN